MKPINKLLFWTPRVLTMAFILFLGLFAFDVFEGPRSIMEKLGGFLIHLIPNFVLLLVLIVSWKREWVAAIFYPAIGAAGIVAFWERLTWQPVVFISGPLFLTGLLFLLGWLDRKRKSAGTP